MLHELSSIVFFWTFSVEMEKKKAYFSSHGQCLLKLEEKGNFFHLKSNFFLWCSCLASFQPTYAWYRHIQMHMKEFLFLLMR